MWVNLPNAPHIHGILTSLTVHRNSWNNTIYRCLDMNNEHEFNAARKEAESKGRYWGWNTVWRNIHESASGVPIDENNFPNKGWGSAYYAARDATAALIAWDDCAYMLDCEPYEISTLAKLGSFPAYLLLPACIALNLIKETHETDENYVE